MIEKRRSQRFRVLKGATIAFEGNDLACTVRNLSDGGAALDFASTLNVPPSFTLVIELQSVHPPLPPGLGQRKTARRRVRIALFRHRRRQQRLALSGGRGE